MTPKPAPMTREAYEDIVARRKLKHTVGPDIDELIDEVYRLRVDFHPKEMLCSLCHETRARADIIYKSSDFGLCVHCFKTVTAEVWQNTIDALEDEREKYADNDE